MPVAGVTVIAAAPTAVTVSATARVVLPVPLVAFAPLLIETATVVLAPAASVPPAGATVIHVCDPVAVKSSDAVPLLLTV